MIVAYVVTNTTAKQYQSSVTLQLNPAARSGLLPYSSDGSYDNATPLITARSREELIRFFDGLELLEPGVVSASLWRPEAGELGTPVEVFNFSGVGRKP